MNRSGGGEAAVPFEDHRTPDGAGEPRSRCRVRLGHLAAWAGVCPGNHESAGKRQGTRTRPGAKHLRTVLIGCAHGAARTRDCQFHTYHKALIVRRGYKRAIVATAHKLARTVFAVLRDAEPYRDPEVDYEALVVKRNAPRWLAKLAEFGILEPRDDGTMTVNWANS